MIWGRRQSHHPAQAGIAVPLPPAGWYLDPGDPRQWRWWSGTGWTNQCSPIESAVAVPVQTTPPATVAQPAELQQTPEPCEVPRPRALEPSPQNAEPMPSLADIVGRLRHENPRYPLEEQIEVAGETYHIKGIKRVFSDHKLPITAAGVTLDDLTCLLVPERWNEHDPNAVAVMIGRHQIGYLPAELAKEYSPPLLALASSGTLASGSGRIWAKNDAGVVRARATLLLPEPQVFL
jgi:Protein of unknown function (DUF2510)